MTDCWGRRELNDLMEPVERFGVSMPRELLVRFDETIRAAGYASRSEAIRDMVRDYLVRQQWDHPDSEVAGTITIVYDHHTRELEESLTDLQHNYGGIIICTTHVHLDAHHCLEVIVVRGRSAEVQAIAQQLLCVRGVKHGGLTATAAKGI